VGERPAAPLPGELEELKEWVRTHPRDQEARLNFARGLWQIGQYADALDSYSRAMRSSKLVDEVLADMEAHLEERPSDATVRRVLGDAYLRVGKLAEALEVYRQALDDL